MNALRPEGPACSRDELSRSGRGAGVNPRVPRGRTAVRSASKAALAPARPGLGLRDRFTTRRQGFSLIEMIVATAILATAIIGLLTLTSVSLSNAAVVREYDRAAMLARSKMSELLEVHPVPLGRPIEGAFDESTRWQARLDPFDAVPPATLGRRMLVRVDLTVFWISGEREKFIQIEGYRSLRIRDEHQGLLGGFR